MFRVEWIQAALDDLASIWMQADAALRQAITTAAQTIDQQLEADPFRQSESREDDERVLFVYPLGAEIEVDLRQRIVWVLHVWQFRQRDE
ncbi:MAG: hypothetical protein HYS12_22080 [Planctomycetes bacterium]|nr:hypothetical protein [Planctomycetota bacterium]